MRSARRNYVWVFLLAVASPLIAGPTTAPAALPATRSATVPRAELDPMYREALGRKYAGVDLDDVAQAHALVEDYFAFTSAESRKRVVRAIESLDLDPNVVGRIVHIRMHWPDLEPGTYYVNERFGPHEVKYFLGVPNGYDRRRAWPLVIKLPTAGHFLADPPPTAQDVSDLYAAWIRDELAAHPDAIVLMPLLNLNELYGPSYAGMNTVIQPMHHAADRVHIDSRRVYLIGHAMAAHAVWNLALHYPTYFAAINPLAGGAGADWQRVRLMNLRNILPVVWHDAQEKVVKVDSSRGLVKILRQMKLDVDYEETKGAGHAPTNNIAERLYGKMRARTRDLYPQQISLQSNRPDTAFNRIDWVQIYQPIRPGDERRLLFRRGTGHMTVYGNTFKVEAARTRQNRVEAVTDNVESLRLYFNDETIDFTRAVGIVVNRKTRFEGMIKPSVEEMLKDQLVIGRGWRYFTGVVDLDLTEPTTRPATTRTTKPTTRLSTRPS